MNIEVSKDNVVILNKSESPHENEYNITECNFTFDEFTNSFQVKRAIFTILSTGEMYEIDIINGKCFTPSEVLKHEYETIKLGVYGYNIEIVNDKETLKERFSPSYDTFVVPTGSYEEGALSPEIITPSQYDIYSQALQEGLDDVAVALEEVSHVDIDAVKEGSIATITITDRNNIEKSVNISDGYTPVKGVDYFTTAEIEQIESETKQQVITELDFDNTVARIDSDIQDLNSNKASKTELENEKTARELADTNLQSQIDAIESGKDVVDIVGTYSDLQNYDTSTLTEDDVIKVLDDSTHNNAMSYYRWTSSTWNYIGSEGPFYTKSETDSLLNAKQATIDSTHKLASDLVDDANQTNKFANVNEKNAWNSKYDKPSNGIPKSDLSASVQESLDKADSAIQDVSDKEDKSNKVTEINSSSTDTQYPSAKCVYDSQVAQDNEIDALKMIYNILPTDTDTGETISIDNTGEMPIKSIELGGNTSQVVIPGESGTNVNATSISINDADTSKEHYFELDGNTYQETTTGKNKYGITSVSAKSYSSGLPTGNATNIVVDSYDLNNVSFHCIYNSYYLVLLPTYQLEPNTSYTLSYTRTNTLVSNASARRWIYSVDNENNYSLIYAYNSGDEGDKTYTFTTTETGKVAIAFGYNNYGNGCSSTINNLMLRLSTESDTYEPYTFGTSPNPSYPQPIEVVTGQNDITICGKNLFDANTVTTGYYISSTNEQVSASGWAISDYIRVNENGIYTYQGLTTAGTNPYSAYYDKNKNFISSFKQAIGTNTITIPNNAYYVRFSMRNTTEHPNPTTFMIEKGSTASTYEAYTGTTYPVNLGNIELCKIGTYQDRIYKSNNKWYLEKNINKASFNGSENWTTGSLGTNSYSYSISDVKLGSNTSPLYIISNLFRGVTYSERASAGNNICYSATSRENSLYIRNTDYQNLNEFTTMLSVKNLIVYYVLMSTTTTEITDSTLVSQLNALSNSTLYSTTNIDTTTSNLLPYIDLQYNVVTPSPSPSRPSVVNVVKGENTITISNSDNTQSQTYQVNLPSGLELCKISTYQDYFYKDNGNWYKHSEIGKTIFTGGSDETWVYFSTAQGSLFRNDYVGVSINGQIPISNYFVGVDGSSSRYNNTIYFNYGASPLLHSTFDIVMSQFDNVTDFKTWLSTHNAIVYYVLGTPTTTEITDTTLVNQLNALKNATSYDTQTNISQTNDDKPFIITAEMFLSLKDVFE